MKKRIFGLLAIVLLMVLAFTSCQEIADSITTQDGTETYPFLVNSRETLGKVGSGDVVGNGKYPWTPESHYKQTMDINLNTGAIYHWTPLPEFKGVYDGNGKIINDLTTNTPISSTGCGLFASINGGTVKNLGLTNVNIEGSGSTNGTGGLAGEAFGEAVIQNCYVKTLSGTGTIKANNSYAGGIVGSGNVVTIEKCYFDGKVNGKNYSGGIIGYARNTTTGKSTRIENCYSKGTVTSANNCAGGIAGQLGNNSAGEVNSIIRYCYSQSTVSGQTNSGGIAGTLGYAAGNIARVINCVALNTSITISAIPLGRVVGANNSNGIVKCYASSDMTAVGGAFTDKTPNGSGGADISSTEFNSAAWWQDVSAVFFSADNWIFSDGYTPKLKNVGGQ